MTETPANDINAMWLKQATSATHVDPRQRFTLKSQQIRADVEKLEREIAALDHTLADLRKIRNTCSALPRFRFE